MTRKETTENLTLEAIRYLVGRGYAVYREISIAGGNSLRGDVVGINSKKEIVVIEVKSGKADYKSDTKWVKYLAFCHKLYFLFPENTIDSIVPLPGKGTGILSLTNGLPKVFRNAEKREVDKDDIDRLLIRMAFRSSLSSFKERKTIQRANKRRKTNL